MGMVNQLGKFSHNLADLTQPLRLLLSKKSSWVWAPDQERAFSEVKTELEKPTVLALYNPLAQTKVSADASSHGLGAVLRQQSDPDSGWRPIAYASRSMTETEKRYAQIEKEALAATWACETFATYILRMKFLIESDHKLLIPLLGTKHLDSLPPRVLRFRLRLARFDYSIQHIPGKLLYTADTLSRSPSSCNQNDAGLQEEAEAVMEIYVAQWLPASAKRLDDYRRAQDEDNTYSSVISYSQKGWPERKTLEADVRPYWNARAELTVVKNNLLLHGKRIVVPKSLQRQTLEKIHAGHQGVQRCRLRANTSVWWPGISHEVENMVKQCLRCARDHTLPNEPMIPTELPEYPWQKVGTDLFHFKGATYLLVVDYFSRYPETQKLSGTTSQDVIEVLKTIFSRHGIPETVFSDNGPQFASLEFTQFAEMYDFHHATSSPLFPQSNGQAERMVQTVKKLLKEAKDPHLSLLTYRTTPFPWCNLSPAELLMGRHLRGNIPLLHCQLIPEWKFLDEFQSNNRAFKDRQKRDYDRRHRARNLSPIPDDSEVWITSGDQPVTGVVITPEDAPRSYVVETPSGQVRRNRHLNTVPETRQTTENAEQSTRDAIMTRSRTGTEIHPPERLGY